MTISVSAIRAMDNRRRTLTDSLSVLKIIGKGPMITAPPPLTFPFPLVAVMTSRITATKAMTKPAKSKMTPILNSN